MPLTGKYILLITRRFLLFCLLVWLFTSCLKKDKYPDVPEIEFISFTKIQNGTGIDDKGILKISFTDGGGDIGLSESDTFPPFDVESQWYYNFFISYYERQKGVLKKINLPFTNNSRIPTLTGTGKNRPTKGEIAIELFINNYFSTYDTIAFEVAVADRSLQLSNWVMTPEIIIIKR